MFEQVEKLKENKNRVVGNIFTQKQSKSNLGFRVVDYRPETIAQRKLHNMVSNNSRSPKRFEGTEVLQRFMCPINKNEVDVNRLKPHEANFYMNLLFNKRLLDINADEILALTNHYITAGFYIPEYDYSSEGPIALKKNTISISVGKNGQFNYQIHWALTQPAPPPGGVVIQTISVIERFAPSGGIKQEKMFFYQEAWGIRTGLVITSNYAQKIKEYMNDMLKYGEDRKEGNPHDDEFAYDDEFAAGSGEILMTGSAVYYNGMNNLPVNFIRNNPETLAGTLPSRSGNKTDDFSGIPSASVPHMIWVKWNQAEEEGVTKITKLI